MAIKPSATTVIEIAPIQTETITVSIRGVSPLIINRLAEKARQELLLPKGRKTTADRASNLKHDPLSEFRSSPYIRIEDDAETYLAIMASSFKKAMMGAALRLPGAKKTEIAQLVHVEGQLAGVFGIPEVFCAITRSADQNRTPDVRTRCIVPEWAAVITITYMVPIITQTSVLNLLSAAGQICGVGDWRPEKGSGTFGQFVVTDPVKDVRFQQIQRDGGRVAQITAMENAVAYNQETEELLSWFDTEVKTRGRESQIKAIRPKAA